MPDSLDFNKMSPEQQKALEKYLLLHGYSRGAVAPAAAIPGQGSGLYTPQQETAIRGMGDIGGGTDELKRQIALSDQLREKVGTGAGGGGIGGNIARAGYGISSAVGDYRARQMQAEILRKRKAILDAGQGSSRYVSQPGEGIEGGD
jgi:hypothetical protein